MKVLSKKTLAGLMAGALSLSIWAPASEAATPKKNQYYSIKLKANQNLAWDVYGGRIDPLTRVTLYDAHNNENQKFVFFPLDGGKYAIVNKNSGIPVSGDLSKHWHWFSSQTLGQIGWTGAPDQQWYLRDQGSNYYEIVNQESGEVASYGTHDENNGSIAGAFSYRLGLGYSNPSNSNGVFKLTATNNISLPKLPSVGTRPSAPKYTGDIDQQLPQTSNFVVVGASLVPSIMVNDNQVSDYTKIHNSPYYVLVKEEYWDKTFSAVIPAGLTRQYSFKTGMTSTDQQKMTETLSMSIGADLGLKFGESTASIKSNITKTLQTEISTTNTQAQEETITATAESKSGKTTAFTEYQLATKYTLKRADGSIVSNPWVVKNNKVTIARDNVQE
ncbi:RICIN domain-containing protein [Bacillus pacificus]|uniref:RICIN domain-containing protein n=1 Tax=Bacillus cereus group TaxID=86661 RepID=UPI00065B88CA|nr:MULTISPECIES: RICIN domain-containing protein [Bacillus cereus group]KMP80418.1 toxin [Bacillus cereus]MCU5256383.1 RICIN domain-containing protein [Bacillus pacificus]PEF56607.1 toxin [Bacillus cereus]USL05351.1 RICIN domain-containing protein [Bacillus anthracis]WCA21735.1 RICIN domain-containing protein [Bacillus paranthracis]